MKIEARYFENGNSYAFNCVEECKVGDIVTDGWDNMIVCKIGSAYTGTVRNVDTTGLRYDKQLTKGN